MPKTIYSRPYAVMLKALVSLRRDAGVTQVELSRRLGKPQPFISNIERGVRRVDVIEFCAIVAALGGKPEAVFAEIAQEAGPAPTI